MTAELLARDVIRESDRLLGPDQKHLVLGAELGAQPRVALLEVVGNGEVRGLSHRPADLGDDELLTAANHLTIALLNELPELQRAVIGREVHNGGRLRVHSRPATGEVSVGVMLSTGVLIEIGRTSLAAPAPTH